MRCGVAPESSVGSNISMLGACLSNARTHARDVRMILCRSMHRRGIPAIGSGRRRSTPCPYGDAIACPSGMKCIAGTPCWAINEGLPTPKVRRWGAERAPLSPPRPMRLHAHRRFLTDVASFSCPPPPRTGRQPTPMPVAVSFPPVKGDDPALRYCGHDWSWVVQNCAR